MPADGPYAAPACRATRTVPDLDRAVGRALQERLFAAAQVVGSVQGGVLHRAAYGIALPPPHKTPTAHETLFDLGHLTMPLGTALGALVLVARRRLDLGKTVAQVLPDFDHAPYTGISLDMLLDHSSGLPADAYLEAGLRAADQHKAPAQQLCGSRGAAKLLREALREVALEAAPGTLTQVSHLGYMLLGYVLEKVTGQPLDLFLQREVYAPLGLEEALLFPGTARGRPRPVKRPYAAHALTHEGRGPGEVADDNAWLQGGVAGHGGLFGTASGVWQLAQTLLDCHRGRPTLFHSGTLQRFWTRSRRFATSRTLGWDTPTARGSNAGGRLPRTAVGHVSPDGPALWIDTQTETVGVLLCNADPWAEAQPLQKVRARVFELVAQHAAGGPPPPEFDPWDTLFSS